MFRYALQPAGLFSGAGNHAGAPMPDAICRRLRGGLRKGHYGTFRKVAQNDRDRKRRELEGLLARDKEFDVLFERLYEDNVSGKIDDTRFSKMSKRYEQEQSKNAVKIKALKADLKSPAANS